MLHPAEGGCPPQKECRRSTPRGPHGGLGAPGCLCGPGPLPTSAAMGLPGACPSFHFPGPADPGRAAILADKVTDAQGEPGPVPVSILRDLWTLYPREKGTHLPWQKRSGGHLQPRPLTEPQEALWHGP